MMDDTIKLGKEICPADLILVNSITSIDRSLARQLAALILCMGYDDDVMMELKR